MILEDFHPHSLGSEQQNDMAFEEDENYSSENKGGLSNIPLQPGTEAVPTPKPMTKGHYIYINLDICTMYLYKNGELLKTYPVSGGKPSSPTPVGSWKIITKDTWGEGFGGAWLGFNIPFGQYGIHGTVEPWFVGKSNQSKGCIRMKNTDVRELYKLAPHGTIVKIEHKNRVFRIMKSGAIGSDILEVQKALKALKYYNGYPDGKFGNGLKKAVIKFQKDNKLYGGGVIYQKTYDTILEKLREKEQEDAIKIEKEE